MNFSIAFTLQIKPFSVNSMYYATRKVKTKEYRAWEEQVLAQLKHVQGLEALKEFKNFTFEMHVEYPEHIFYNSKGEISSKTVDKSNDEKALIDVIFGQYLNLNDKYIVRLVSGKYAGAGHAIHVLIEASK